MSGYSRCPECGWCIGELEDAYDILSAYFKIKNVKDPNIRPDKLLITKDILADEQPIFEALGIKNMCCRTHLMTKYPFDSIYASYH
jgi:DNA-directed RNA polymerase subunit N (RpoN/RPB10)